MKNLNRENLKIAIEGLKSLNISKEQFDILTFGGIDSLHKQAVRSILKTSCDTIACAVGWCPFIEELGPVDSDFCGDKFSYDLYSERIFGEIDYELWEFMFEMTWHDYDNTLEGAIARMQYVYDGKYTDNWVFEDFKQGWHDK